MRRRLQANRALDEPWLASLQNIIWRIKSLRWVFSSCLALLLIERRQEKMPTWAILTPNGDPEGSRTLDFLDENQTSWTTRRRDHLDT